MTYSIFSRNVLFSLLFSIVFVITGCATSTMGRDFNFDDARTIKTGTTTKDQVLKTLGPPQSRQVMQGGRESWYYSFSTSKVNPFNPFNTSTGKGKSLVVTFINDIVQHCQVSFSESKMGLHSTVPIASSVPCDQAP
jgi:outer membrane protein assembly factor BamE (lipoprotein component of BamABCDE complex)